MSFRSWLSVVTLSFIAIILFFSRHELAQAWKLLESVNIWILLLLIPGQILVYFIGGEMMFSYLREKKSIEEVKPAELTKMSLEMNFVNHVLPSGGVSGISYMSWRMSKLGVSAGRATVAQVVRYAMGFVSFIVLLAIAVLAVTIDGGINRWIILVSSALVTLMVGTLAFAIFLFSAENRVARFSGFVTRNVNKLVNKVTFGKKKNVLMRSLVDKYFTEMHTDYMALSRDKNILKKPFLWGILFNIFDVSLFLITFWALGHPVNPAPVVIAYGVAAAAGFFVITPGGAGAYEAIMVAFLAVAGLDKGAAIAGILLTRVILLLGTIVLGYVFYQQALAKYGKRKK